MKLELIEQKPVGAPRPTPILFVHGAWHGAWCWEKFLPYFAKAGYEVTALSLRGHGASEGRRGLRWYSASKDYVEDVACVVRGMKTPPVLVGHSMGGFVVQKYLEKNTLPAGVLVATTPVSGILAMCLRICLRHPIAFLKTSILMWPWYLVNTARLAKDTFFSDSMPDVEVQKHFARIQPESFLMVPDCAFLNLPKPDKVKTPMLVLAGEQDRVFTLEEQRATAQAYHTELKVFPGTAHDMMLEQQWQAVADHILGWLRGRGL